MGNKFNYYIFNKPFQVLCQFSSSEGDDKQTLKHYLNLPSNVYPLGRLDYDSEGLLLLTDNAAINKQLLHPTQQHQRTYWVQVEGVPTPSHLHQLAQGVSISVNKNPYNTLPCEVSLLNTEDVAQIPERNPPIRYRQHIPTTWLSISLCEGKNRQVRKMFAAIGYPVLRLIRYSIEGITLGNLQPGNQLKIAEQSFLKKLNLL